MSEGFDDMFNEGLFRAGLHNSIVSRPAKWPKSTSEMGRHTSYTEQSRAPGDYNDGMFRAGLHNTQQSRPDMWPKSVSEMRRHTSYAPQGMGAGHETAHQAYAEKRAASEGRWVWDPSQAGYVWAS